MANSKKIRLQGFKFKPFSKKQLKLLNWWNEDSPVNDKFMIIADGAIRSGKTISMILSFVLFVMRNFNQQNAAMCGKSVGSFRRNVLIPLKQIMLSLDYDIVEHRSENYVEIIKGDIVNYFYIFGAKDESSQDLIQGITLCALLLDEVALMPESFYNQATARLSVEGAKCFCNCNPSSPYHWFYRNVLKSLKEKDGLYVHFDMEDNLSLSEDIINRYKKMYSGVFYERYIKGRWVVANGLIYDMFMKSVNQIEPEEIPYEDAVEWCIAVDYGTGNATVFLLLMKDSKGTIYVCKEYYFAGRKEAQEQNDYEAQKTDLEFAEDMRNFITENYNLTGKTYRQIDIMIDPAASSFKLQLRRFHMKSKNATNEVLDGIRTVATYLGKGDLKISSECENTLQEIHTYVWDDKAQEKGIDRPLKVNDHCVTGDTLVNTTDGYKKIEDLVNTSGYLYTIDKDNHTIVKRYKEVRLTRENAEIIKLLFDNGDNIRLTKDHLVLTRNRSWVKAQDLTCIDEIVTLDSVVHLSSSLDDGICDVYNLEVEDVHCFAVTNSNIIIHNCLDAMRYGIMKLKDKSKLVNATRNLGL